MSLPDGAPVQSTASLLSLPHSYGTVIGIFNASYHSPDCPNRAAFPSVVVCRVDGHGHAALHLSHSDTRTLASTQRPTGRSSKEQRSNQHHTLPEHHHRPPTPRATTRSRLSPPARPLPTRAITPSEAHCAYVRRNNSSGCCVPHDSIAERRGLSRPFTDGPLLPHDTSTLTS